MSLTVYYSSVTGNMEMKKQQAKIFMILDSKKISYEKKDIASDESLKTEMREICENETALPPQLARGSVYLGNYDAFEAAVEEENLEIFLKMN